jgi:benzoylformate decarboxylase
MPTRAADIFERLSDFDCIFALGGKSLITILYTEHPVIPPHVDVLQLSGDVRDLGRTYSTRLSVVGDIRASLAALTPLLAARLGGGEAQRASADAIAAANAARRTERAATASALEGAAPIAPLVAAREMVRAIGPDVPIVDEAVCTSFHVRSFLHSPSARQYAFLRGGALGWGMPAAVGFSLGFDRAPVVCMVGDGAALYSPQALWTAAHENLPVTFVVLNNREYNILKNFMKGQKHYLSAARNHFIAMDIEKPAIDFLTLAASMGVPARRIERAGDIAPAIEAGIASGRANLIEVVIGVE